MDEVRIYTFKLNDMMGKQNPHFDFVQAHMGKKTLIANHSTPVTGFATRLDPKYYAMRMNKKDCLMEAIRSAEESLEHHKKKVIELEAQLSVMKYLDAENLPEFDKKGNEYF